MPVPESSRVTLATIAARAGVSVPTASKVLNGKSDVSSVTRESVIRLAQELGYQRLLNRAAAVQDKVRHIDVVVGHLDGTWINQVLAGIERVTASADVDLALSIARADGQWLSRILRRPSLGVIAVLVDASPQQLSFLRAANVPVVVVDAMSRPPVNVTSVGATNWNGGRVAAEHLLAKGHRTFGIVSGDRNHLYSRARVDGFQAELREADIPPESTTLVNGNWDRETARREASRILETVTRPTAIFACSDVMAFGVYDAAEALGLTIPHALSVVGFDDIQESTWAHPPLTTVQQPIVEMGAAAAQLLLRDETMRTQNTIPAGTTRIELETRLIERQSTAPPP